MAKLTAPTARATFELRSKHLRPAWICSFIKSVMGFDKGDSSAACELDLLVWPTIHHQNEFPFCNCGNVWNHDISLLNVGHFFTRVNIISTNMTNITGNNHFPFVILIIFSSSRNTGTSVLRPAGPSSKCMSSSGSASRRKSWRRPPPDRFWCTISAYLSPVAKTNREAPPARSHRFVFQTPIIR